MATKLFALLALLALSVSATTAVIIPQCSFAPNAITPQFLPSVTPFGYEHPAVQAYRLQQALAASILQQPIAQLQEQSSAHLTVQTIAAQQQQQQLFQPAFSPLAMANPTAYLQQQLLASNPLVLANAAAYQQQQQLQQVLSGLTQLAVVNSAAYLQQQQLLASNPPAAVNAAIYLQQQQLQQILPALSQLTMANPVAYLQQQQPLSFNQLTVANTAAYLQQQQLLPVNPLVVANPLVAAFLQQQQSSPFNQISLINPALPWQQPIIGGGIF
ncbi:hypothetical protein BDA96_05G205600 [Sorghum bicolor]|jgi:hypothetical protein|uniref:Uncharacterized protein n=2 Tax=Sorghum bicolor TaxID=4558 RepID=A0A921QZH9_SORBI|nr:kafirin PSKR2-like [Sorghum bicolor]KAG0530656.1 hypothetical protein BDA96_05G205600 [Sorghum bicolor]OQU83856.1 hypothetical protein SORBI_3005G189000 [Sorghum bicolor]|eukprot:XP_002451130.1 kafirin PSKR2-like [Sorghum bicolor]